MTLRAQDLKHRIEFQRNYEQVDLLTGMRTNDWRTYRTMFARADPIMGREYMAAQASQANIDYKFTCRFFPDALPSDRIVLNGEVFDMFSIINVRNQNRELLIYAKKNY